MPTGDGGRVVQAAAPSAAVADHAHEHLQRQDKGRASLLPTAQEGLPLLFARAATSYQPPFFNANERNWHRQRKWMPLLYSEECSSVLVTPWRAVACKAPPPSSSQRFTGTTTGSTAADTCVLPARGALGEEGLALPSPSSFFEIFLLQCFSDAPIDGEHAIFVEQAGASKVMHASEDRGAHQACAGPTSTGYTVACVCSSYKHQNECCLLIRLTSFLLISDFASLAVTSRLVKELLLPFRSRQPWSSSPARATSSSMGLVPRNAFCVSPSASSPDAASLSASLYCRDLLRSPQAYMLREKVYALFLWRAVCGGPFTNMCSCCVVLLPDIVGNCVSSYWGALRQFIVQQRQWLSFRPFFHQSWQNFHVSLSDEPECFKTKQRHAPQTNAGLRGPSLLQCGVRQHSVPNTAVKQRQQLCDVSSPADTSCQTSKSVQAPAANISLADPLTAPGVLPAASYGESLCSVGGVLSAVAEVSTCPSVTTAAERDTSTSGKLCLETEVYRSKPIANEGNRGVFLKQSASAANAPGKNCIGTDASWRDSRTFGCADGSFVTAMTCSRFSQSDYLPVIVSALSSDQNAQGSWCRLWTFPDDLRMEAAPLSPPTLFLPASSPPVAFAVQRPALETKRGVWWSSWMQFLPQKPLLVVMQQRQLQSPHISASKDTHTPVVAISLYDCTALLDICRTQQEGNEENGDRHAKRIQSGLDPEATSVSSGRWRIPSPSSAPCTLSPVRTKQFSLKEVTTDTGCIQTSVWQRAAGIVDAAFPACSGNCPLDSNRVHTANLTQQQYTWGLRPEHLWVLLASGTFLVMDTERLVTISRHTAEKSNFLTCAFTSREDHVVGRRVLPFSSADHSCGGPNSGEATSAAVVVHEKAFYFADKRTSHMSIFAKLDTGINRGCTLSGACSAEDASIAAADATGATLAALLDSAPAVRLWDVRGKSTHLVIPSLSDFHVVHTNKSFQLERATSHNTATILQAAMNSDRVLRYMSSRFAYFSAADAATTASREIVTLSRRLMLHDHNVSSPKGDALQAAVLRRAALRVAHDGLFVVQQRHNRRYKASALTIDKGSDDSDLRDDIVPPQHAASNAFGGHTSLDVEQIYADGAIHQWRWGCSSPWRTFMLCSTPDNICAYASQDLRPAGIFQSPSIPAHMLVLMQRAAFVKIIRLSRHAACCRSPDPLYGEPPALWPLTT